MADISQIQVGNNLYDIKDNTARNKVPTKIEGGSGSITCNDGSGQQDAIIINWSDTTLYLTEAKLLKLIDILDE